MRGIAHTFDARFEKTLEYIHDPDVTFVEAVAHLYLWARFEWTISRRDRYQKKARKIARQLNANLDVVVFRKRMNAYDRQG
jgi:hypothetical protein